MSVRTPVVETVCVGLPRAGGDPSTADPTRGPWTTGIFKAPIEGPVALGALGLVGDGQADLINHGGTDKALCAYSADHYAGWQDAFSASSLPSLTHGAFGENLTISSLDEGGVCIGDVWTLGDTVLQVSQPRQPCWKLARKWGIRSFAEQVVASGRTGWYFRVLTPGTVSGGLVMALRERPQPQWTIQAANDVMHRRVGDTRALASLPELAASWQHTLAKRLER